MVFPPSGFSNACGTVILRGCTQFWILLIQDSGMFCKQDILAPYTIAIQNAHIDIYMAFTFIHIKHN